MSWLSKRALAAGLVGASMLTAVPVLAQDKAARPASIPDASKDPVAYGKYMAEAADCMPCHTAAGGKPFAGGRSIETPFGAIYSPNITPDKSTGIGDWTQEEFYAALHTGIGKGGEDLYPAMPYTSYTKMLKADVDAIYGYLKTVEPVVQKNRPNALPFPFNIRRTLGFWRELYFTEGTFQPDPKLSDQLNRGAYLVEGPGHCGECHTPRTVLGGTETDEGLRGAQVDDWFAPNISGSFAGLGSWSDQQVVDFLGKGAAKGKGAVFGPMQEVVHDSLSKLALSDIQAVAAYLKQSAAQPSEADSDADEVQPVSKAAAQLYVQNCSQCHQPKGVGVAGSIPALAGNATVQAASPDNIVQAMLFGIKSPGGNALMPSFATQLDDQEVAEIANYVRTAWGNKGVPNATSDLVASLRQHDAAGLPAAGQQSAEELSCPEIDASGTGDGIQPPDKDVLAALAQAPESELEDRIGKALADMKKDDAQASQTSMVNTLLAAYCPQVAATDLSDEAKKQRLAQFRKIAYGLVYAPSVPADARKIILRVAVDRATAQKVNAEARKAKEKPDDWAGKILDEALK